MEKYANQIGYTDIYPFEIVKVKSEKKVLIRKMKTELDPNWKPQFVAGGFSANCTNQETQSWIITGNQNYNSIAIRKHKDGKWYSADGARFRLSEHPVRFYDYNF